MTRFNCSHIFPWIMSDIQRWTFWLGESRRKWLTAAIFRDLDNGVCLSELKEWNCEWISLNFQFSGELVPKKDHLTLFLRFKCSNGKTDSLKSGIYNFWEEAVNCWNPDLKLNWAFAVSLKLHPPSRYLPLPRPVVVAR